MFPREYQQVTPGSILHRVLAQWWGIQHHINGVAYFDGNVIARGVRGATSGSLMSLNLGDRAHLILRSGLAKGRKHCQTDKKQTHQPQHNLLLSFAPVGVPLYL